jgi:hypothetical protein
MFTEDDQRWSLKLGGEPGVMELILLLRHDVGESNQPSKVTETCLCKASHVSHIVFAWIVKQVQMLRREREFHLAFLSSLTESIRFWPLLLNMYSNRAIECEACPQGAVPRWTVSCSPTATAESDG